MQTKKVKKGSGGFGKEIRMEEKVYKTMSGSGALNITIGVILLVIGVASGVMMIISGAKLLAAKSKIMF